MKKQTKEKNINKTCVTHVGAGLASAHGITIIALVITIIVLLILAGVSINMVIGKNGIIKQAQEQKEQQKIEEITDELEANKVPVQLENQGEITVENYIAQIIKQGIIDKYDVEEIEEVSSKYITVQDRYVYLIEEKNDGDIEITYQGIAGNLPPSIVEISKSKTSNSITVEVKTKRAENGQYSYYYKKQGETEYILANTNPIAETTYTYTNLEQNVTYYIKVVVKVEGKESAERETTETTGEVEGLTKENTTFTVTPSTWTNGNVKVGISTIVTGNTLVYSIDNGKTWINYTGKITINSNQPVHARLKDSAGNMGETTSVNITNIDKIEPTGVTISASGVTWNGATGTVTLTGKGTDALSGIVAYQFSTNSGLTATSSGWTSITNTKIEITQTQNVTTSGTYYFYVKDEAGNVAKSEGVVVTISDTTVPTLTIAPSTAAWTNQNITVTVTAEDTQSGVAGIAFTTSENTPTSWDEVTSKAYTVTTNGTYYAWAKDSAGNITSTTGRDITNIDKLKPSSVGIRLKSKGIDFINLDAVNVSDAAATSEYGCSGIRRYEFYMKKSSESIYTEVWSTSPGDYDAPEINDLEPNTTYNAYLRAYDAAGNYKDSEILTVTTGTIDLTDSNVTFTVTPSTWTNEEVEVTIDVDIEEAYGSYDVQYSIDNENTWTDGNTVTMKANGTVHARIQYETGVTGETASRDITNIDNTPPTISNIWNNSNNNWTSGTIKIGFSCSDSQSGIAYSVYSYDKVTEYTDWDTETASTAPSGTWSAERNKEVFVGTYDVAGNFSGWYSAGYVKIDRTKPTKPVIASTKNMWTNYDAVTLQTPSTAASGIKQYEYYRTSSSTIPTDDTIAMGTTANNIIITDKQIYATQQEKLDENFCRINFSASDIAVGDVLDINIVYTSPTDGMYNDFNDVSISGLSLTSLGNNQYRLTGSFKVTEYMVSTSGERPYDYSMARFIDIYADSIDNYTVYVYPNDMYYTYYRAVSNTGIKSDWSDPAISYVSSNTFLTLVNTYNADGLCVTNGAYKSGTSIVLPADSWSIQFGPYITLYAGCYYIEYSGENLDNVSLMYQTTYNSGVGKSTIIHITKSENEAGYFINITEDLPAAEFTIVNTSATEETIVNSIKLYKATYCPDN